MTDLDKKMYSHFYDEDNKRFVFKQDYCIYCGDIVYNTNAPICVKCEKPLSRNSIIEDYEVARPFLI